MSEQNSFHSFQQQVSTLLLRHRSFLDVTSKFQESNGRVNRALMKAVTECGCLEVHATRQSYPADGSLLELKDELKTHLSGQICENCKDILKAEMGKNLFYLTSLCNLLDIDLQEVIDEESARLSALGPFNMR